MVADDAKVILITGASQGLGQAMAIEIARHGQKVIVNYIKGCEEGAEETCKRIMEAGGDAFAIEADCSKPDQVHTMFEKAVEHYGTVDVIVNNAGVTRDNLVARMKPADWNFVLNVNLSGVFYCCQEFIKHAVTKGGGRIINMASVVGQIGNPGQANYAASKGGVIGLTKGLAVEFAANGIKVNAVCPGFIDTPMAQKLGDKLDTLKEAIPLKRLGTPEEVAALVRFLALDLGAEYMTGHCIDIDGGIAIAAA
jgi:3-oxoacyl-[acyl-carrier protein] reductase